MERLTVMTFLGNAAEGKAVLGGRSTVMKSQALSPFCRNQVGWGVLGTQELCPTEGKPNVKALRGRRRRYTRAPGPRIPWASADTRRVRGFALRRPFTFPPLRTHRNEPLKHVGL